VKGFLVINQNRLIDSYSHVVGFFFLIFVTLAMSPSFADHLLSNIIRLNILVLQWNSSLYISST